MKTKPLIKAFMFLFIAFFTACGGGSSEEDPSLDVITVSGLTYTPTYTTAEIEWTTNVATTHIVEWGTSSGAYIYSTVESALASTSHSVTLTGLSSCKTYYYRIKNYHAALTDTTSDEETLTTSTEAEPTLAQKLRGIWILGGLSGQAISTTVQEVDLFDPVTETWYPAVTTMETATNPNTTPVSFAGAASCNGKIYVFGGFNSSGEAVSTVQIFDIANNSWSTGYSMDEVRAHVNAVMLNQRIYVLGGTAGPVASTAWYGSTTSYEYTPATNTWATKTAFTAGTLSDRGAVAYNDGIYNFGGRTSALNPTATHDGLAGVTGGAGGLTTTSTEVVLSASRTGFATVLYTPEDLPAKILVIGGFNAIIGNTGCYIFNNSSLATPLSIFQYLAYPFVAPSTWQTMTGALPASLGFGAAAIYNETLFFFGGTAYPPGGSDAVYSYDLTGLPSGTWDTRAVMPRARFGHCAVTIDQ